MANKVDSDLDNLKKIAQLQDSISIKKQQNLVKKVILKDKEALLELLITRLIIEKNQPSYIDAIIFEEICTSNELEICRKLEKLFKGGIVDLKSSCGIDYEPLQKLLISKQFQKADQLTQRQLCNLAGLNSDDKRNWLYFTDISILPCEDLNTIDTLWRIYSLGQFGFSIQRKIWLSNNRNWDLLWDKIGWTVKNSACRYPDEFIWDTVAPQGHLPLFNQLRGVQVLSALFEHSVWNQRDIEIK
uniref:GUN4-like domain-containing protein n=1 Tax=Ahnfeltia plicata TaxID=28023 RepID=A0A1C9CB60_9FLOR|nr:hypothetical protein Ahnf_120 [Ahnfeltia plicata]AOM65605.1 hypothetical protein Ahnf_120 [Ahnfeltia plicata]UAT97173.1 hypothetical protein Ahn.pli.UK.pt_076 [Ahnfeltia plicata]UAT97378.1 hypothetical protein Ahn.pli.Chile.pt_076 [Ahnfeltia plicata]